VQRRPLEKGFAAPCQRETIRKLSGQQGYDGLQGPLALLLVGKMRQNLPFTIGPLLTKGHPTTRLPLGSLATTCQATPGRSFAPSVVNCDVVARGEKTLGVPVTSTTC